MNNSGSGAASGTTFNGASAVTISYNTIGAQPLATNLTSVAGLTYASLAFVKMSAAGTFSLDTNTYLTASTGVTSVTGTANQITVTGTTTPTLSIPSAFVLPGTINGATITTTTTGTLTLANSSTLQTTGAFTLNLTTTAASTPTFPTGTYTLAQITNGQTFAGTNTFATIVATTVENVAGTTLTLDSLTHTAAMTGTTVSGSYTGASVAQIGVGLTPTINQTGTSSFTALDVNSTNSAFGTGAQYLLNLRGAGNSVLNVGNLTYGALVTDTGFGLNMPAQTYTATGTSTVASMGLIHIGQATLTNAGVGTVTALATLLIDNAPAVAGSQVGTNKYALDVLAGTSIFNGTINNITVTAPASASTHDTSGGSFITIGAFSLTLTATNTTVATFPTGTITLAQLGAQTFSGAQTFGVPASGASRTTGLAVAAPSRPRPARSRSERARSQSPGLRRHPTPSRSTARRRQPR